MDIDEDLWKEVGVAAIKLEIQKRELVEMALREFLDKNKKEVPKSD